MSYATYEQLTAAFGEKRVLDALAKTTQEDPEDHLERKLEAASGFMDSYFALKYTVPIDTTGNVSLAAMLAECACICALGMLSPGYTQRPEGLKEAFADCKEWLKKVAEGDAILPGLDRETGAFGVVGTDDPLITKTFHENNRLRWLD